MNKDLFERMYKIAIETRENAYVPYSDFKVGACVLMKDGALIGGCNAENASYGLCLCAERNAMFKAISMGYKPGDFEAILVLADTSDPCSPCGACRQVMSEFFEKDKEVVLTNLKKDVKVFTIEEILPYSFTKNDLK